MGVLSRGQFALQGADVGQLIGGRAKGLPPFGVIPFADSLTGAFVICPIGAAGVEAQSHQGPFQLAHIGADSAGHEVAVGGRLAHQDEQRPAGSGEQHVPFLDLRIAGGQRGDPPQVGLQGRWDERDGLWQAVARRAAGDDVGGEYALLDRHENGRRRRRRGARGHLGRRLDGGAGKPAARAGHDHDRQHQEQG